MVNVKKKYLERTLEFHKIYQQEILPILKKEEPLRRALVEKRVHYWLFMVFLWILPVVFFTYWLKCTDQLNPVLPILSAIFLSAASLCSFFPLYRGKNSEFIHYLKERNLHKVLRVFGDISWVKDSQCITNNELKASALFPNYNRRVDDDEFMGSYQGVDFKISETELLQIRRSKNGESKERMFKGIILSFEANKTIKNRTIVATKGDVTQKNAYLYSILPIFAICVRIIMQFDGSSSVLFLYALIFSLPIAWAIAYFFREKDNEPLNEIKLEDSKFCKKFNVYSSDQVEARYLLTTAFMERFQNLKTKFGAKKVKCSFFDNQIMFAISTDKNIFEMANINTPLTDPRCINELYDELSSVYKMISYFKLDEKTGL